MEKEKNKSSSMEKVDEESQPVVRKPFPKSVIYIIGNEFCERFSFYGMRTILVLYLTGRLGYSDDTATIAFHMFVMGCYFTPLIGAVLADSFWGRYWTILVISSIYAAGSVVIAFASVAASVAMTMIGLALIAFGTGGIKPCVSTFGGDQFVTGQEKQLKRFFSFFYLAINSGGLLSTAITPIFREDIPCMGDDTCYPLAFGVPAALMIISVTLFVMGRFTSGYRIIPPEKKNVLVSVVSCIGKSIWRKIFSSKKEKHWLDHARGDFDDQTIHDVKALMRILFLFIPIPVFWALFDQQSSRWTLQARLLNGNLGFYTIKPDQIQVINPILIVTFIPLFDYFIYPMLNRFGLKKPLRRMVIGGLLAGLAFGVCGLLQTRIETESPEPLTPGNNHLMLINGDPFPLERMDYPQKSHPLKLEPYQIKIYPNLPREILNETQPNDPIPLENDQTMVVFFRDSRPTMFAIENILVKPENGGARVITVFYLYGAGSENSTFKATFVKKSIPLDRVIKRFQNNGTEEQVLGLLKTFEPAVKGEPVVMSVGDRHNDPGYQLGQGASFVQLIVEETNGKSSVLKFNIQEVVKANQLSVFTQLFQYLLITCAEIMFSVTGLEFCYSQAPKSMKSVIQAAWLLTVTIGNMMVAIIADIKMFEKQSYEFFFFGILMFIDMGLFAWIAYYYIPYTTMYGEEVELPPHPVPPLQIAAVEGELPLGGDLDLDQMDHHQNTITRLSKL